MPDLDAVRRHLELTPEELREAGVVTHAIPPVPAVPRHRPKLAADTMDEMRTLFARHVYHILLKPSVLARLEEHLLAEDRKLSLKAFETVLGDLLANTKPAEHPRGPVVPIQIVTNIPRPGP
jgi:hypothetical protein